MSEPLGAATTTPPSLSHCTVGFYGKIPARGDFVRNGLPQAFVEPWDHWLQQRITASRATLGDNWIAAWMEAAIWSFALPPGICGPNAVLGLWMPSVDRVGRHFPLTVAAVAPAVSISDFVRDNGGFLVAAEQAGLAAVESDLGPDELADRLQAAAVAPTADPGIDPAAYPGGNTLWWTEGAPRVPRSAFACKTLPDDLAFAAMLDAGTNTPTDGASCA